MSLISPITRARVQRLARTFQEVRASTGSTVVAARHMIRFVGKKLRPLGRYLSFTATRFVLIHRLRRRQTETPAIGIRVLGGIGDYVVIARFLRDLARVIEPVTFDIYSNKSKTAEWVFSFLPGFRCSYDEAAFAPAMRCYSVALQVSQFILIQPEWVLESSMALTPRLQAIVARIRAFQPSIQPIIAEHPRLDSFLAQKAIFANKRRQDYLHSMAGIDYAGDQVPLPQVNDLRPASAYVTVHNGYDPSMVVSGLRATKCYPHFGEVIGLLRRENPSILFVQVGVRTSQPIAEADVNLVGSTSLSQVAGLIQGALFHLDNESGLVHIARALGTKSCVVFGPTSSRYFGYPANINVDPTFCGGCWWITETWMNHCPRGFGSARCMSEQPASAVAWAAMALVNP